MVGHTPLRLFVMGDEAADFAEIETLMGALGEAGRGIVQATVGRELFLDQFAALVKNTGRPVTWTALLAGMGGLAGPEDHREILVRSRALRVARSKHKGYSRKSGPPRDSANNAVRRAARHRGHGFTPTDGGQRAVKGFLKASEAI